MNAVEVTFTPAGPKRTTVVLEHRNLERFGVMAEQVRKSVDSPEGWGVMMTQFAAAVAA